MRKCVGRHRIPVAALAAGFAALIFGLGLSLGEARTAHRAALRAEAEARRAERVKSFLISVFQQSDPEAGEGSKLTARELLQRGAASVETGLAGEPEVQADLFDAVARIEKDLGFLDPALAHAQRALTLRQAVLPPADGRIGLSNLALGEVQEARGGLEGARQAFEAAPRALGPALGARRAAGAPAPRGPPPPHAPPRPAPTGRRRE